MLWFRLGAVISIFTVLVWSLAVLWAIISMFTYGSTIQSIVDDPTKNGTAFMYICVCIVELLVTSSSVFGLFIAFKVWRNNYQIDHRLRHFFIIWLGMWGLGTLALLSISIYMLMRGKDHQENMAILYDSFQRHTRDQKFVSTLEKYQKENQCCGIYGSDDWLLVQLRQFPGGGGGGLGMGYPMGGGMDSAFMMNPSTGRCHFMPPTIPPGCGTRIQEDMIFKVKIYAACAIAQVIVAMVAGALSWYCFFYWLEKEVIVIPEDEVSNIIIIEPASSSSLNVYSEKFQQSHHRHPRGSRSMTESELNSATAILRHDSGRAKNSWNAQKSFREAGRSSYDRRKTWSHTRLKDDLPYGKYFRNSNFSQGSRAVRHSRSHHSVIHLTSAEILREQEMALGGHVLAEMHVAHRSNQMLRPANSRAGKHHATVAIVRNKQPRPKKGLIVKGSRHGQTGNLAQDIADMSGNTARGYLEDVLVPLTPPGVRPKAIQIPLGARVRPRSRNPITANNPEIDQSKAQDFIENIIAAPQHQDRAEAEPSVVVGRHGEIVLHSHNQNVTKPHILPSLRHKGPDTHHHHGSLIHGHDGRHDSHNQHIGSHEHGRQQHQESHLHHGLHAGTYERGSFYHHGVRTGNGVESRNRGGHAHESGHHVGHGHESGHHGGHVHKSGHHGGHAHESGHHGGHGHESGHHGGHAHESGHHRHSNSNTRHQDGRGIHRSVSHHHDERQHDGSSRIERGRYHEYHGSSVQGRHTSADHHGHGVFNRKFDRPTTVLYKSTKPFNDND